MGPATSHIPTPMMRMAGSPQILPNDVAAQDFAQAAACSCYMNHLGEWIMCLEHESIMADMLSSTSARDAYNEADERDAAEDRSYVMLLRRFHAGEPPAVAFDDHSAGLGVPNRDFGYDDGWAEVFASTAPGGEVVEAPADDNSDYAEQFALSVYGDDHGRNRQRPNTPLQPDLTRSFSGESDASSYISDDASDYDSDGNEMFRLRLPVASPLAQRRYLARDEDLKCVTREQRFQAEYEVARRRGEITEPGDLFRDIDWNQQSSKEKTEDVSPRTVPRGLRAPGRNDAVVAASWMGEYPQSQSGAHRQSQNEIYARMRDTEGFQSFPSPPRPYAPFTVDWDDDLMFLDTASDMQRQAQNEEITMWVLDRARERQEAEVFQSFPNPPFVNAFSAANWDDDLVVVDTRSEMQRQAQNEEIWSRMLQQYVSPPVSTNAESMMPLLGQDAADELYGQVEAGHFGFSSPPPDQWSMEVTTDEMFGGMVEYL